MDIMLQVYFGTMDGLDLHDTMLILLGRVSHDFHIPTMHHILGHSRILMLDDMDCNSVLIIAEVENECLSAQEMVILRHGIDGIDS
jgi:hypothetical protein